MKIFTVLSMDDFSKKLSLEPFSSLELALVRAAWIARHIYGLTPNENPAPQHTGFSTDVEYLVYQDNESVIISVLEQEIREALPHFRGDHANSIPEPPVVATPSPPPDDPREQSLPAGWDYSGKPIRMDVLLNNPESVEAHFDLTTDQQFALAIARVSKRPHFFFLTDIGVLVQSSALYELKNRTEYGWQIKDHEMEYLDSLREIEDIDYHDD